jgi:hypothetical protein
MLGANSTGTWWRRPVLLAGASGVVAGVVIGGASHSLPASSTGPIGPGALSTARPTVTVTVAAPAVTLTQTRTVTVVVTPAATPVAGPRPVGSAGSSAAATQAVAPKAHASSQPAHGATALCKDGTLSYAAQHQGACSHHGGVAHWYR